ncbi:MAG: hypothetical protein HY915_02275 [Desulfovibrio sp.]|nr:hypothetical protein [Desulfovibrio sp.]
MDGTVVIPHVGRSVSPASALKGVNEVSPEQHMKDYRKARVFREGQADPDIAKALVAIEASPVYNAKAELISAVVPSELGTG